MWSYTTLQYYSSVIIHIDWYSPTKLGKSNDLSGFGDGAGAGEDVGAIVDVDAGVDVDDVDVDGFGEVVLGEGVDVDGLGVGEDVVGCSVVDVVVFEGVGVTVNGLLVVLTRTFIYSILFKNHSIFLLVKITWNMQLSTPLYVFSKLITQKSGWGWEIKIRYGYSILGYQY